jgi:hypothetical protein
MDIVGADMWASGDPQRRIFNQRRFRWNCDLVSDLLRKCQCALPTLHFPVWVERRIFNIEKKLGQGTFIERLQVSFWRKTDG